MKKVLLHFGLPYLAFLFLGLFIVLTNLHGATVLWFNARHSPFWDVFFRYTTELGDGWMLAVLIIVLLIFKRRYGLILGLIGVSQAIISWVLKHWIFGKVPRPKMYFDETVSLNFVEGIKMHGWNSFPSGHSITAFSMAAFLALYFKKPALSYVFLMIGIIGGISRIYLLQHFLVDVLAGSLIGVLLSFGCYWYFRQYLEQRS